MPAILTERRNETKLRVEEAVRQVSEDCGEIRFRTGIFSPTLKPKDVVKITREAVSIMEEKGRKYSYYEIGHRFIVENIISDLQDKIGLDPEEAKLLAGVCGRVYYNIPPREYTRVAEAASALAELGLRGQEIFDAWKKEYEILNDRVKMLMEFSPAADMFANATLNPYTSCRDFAEVATKKRNMAKSIENREEDTTLYL